MNWLGFLYADLSTGFTLYDVPVILAQCFIALALALAFKKIYLRQASENASARLFLPISILGVMAGIVAKTGLPGSILGLGLLLMCGNFFSNESALTKVVAGCILVCSVLCGFSQVPLAVIACLLLLVFLLLKGNK
ncbi:MAG TPA: hypothetical protein VD905_20450 [Flavobacteriales bacterium]|nr:hypothetical protein [Flavobacteriales bacterium]